MIPMWKYLPFMVTAALVYLGAPVSEFVLEPVDTFSSSDEDDSVAEENLKDKLPFEYISSLTHEINNMEVLDVIAKTRATPDEHESPFHTLKGHSINYVWLPRNITCSSNQTTLIYQQEFNRDFFADYVTAWIVLTVLNVPVTKNSSLIMLLNWDKNASNSQPVQRIQQILRGQKFYTFDITEFLRFKLSVNSTKEETNFINITFRIEELGEEQKVLDVGDFFNLNGELPTIFLFYTRNFPSPNSTYESPARRWRSVGSDINANNFTYDMATAASNPCRRHDFYVTRDDIGWPTLVAPETINIGLCLGVCPFPLQDPWYNFTSHNFFVDRIRHSMGHMLPSGFPKPECGAVTYKPLQVLEMAGKNTSILRTILMDNMIVETCGCSLTKSCLFRSH